ncbi:CHAP domain-containing protein, partial [Candidatus Peregrinibacteria bacterium]|nr:CHAP domain-containing protein [Candidatus Peregrinibacteria bacterium]
MFTYKDNSNIPFGKIIQKISIDSVDITVYSNGKSDFIDTKKNYDKEGNYLGIRYQCVEFVRRYIYKRDGINLALLHKEGNADTWHSNRELMKLESIDPHKVQIGDIPCFQGGHTGHIAIVSDIDEKYVYMTSQNLYNTEEEIHFPLDKASFFKKNI